MTEASESKDGAAMVCAITGVPDRRYHSPSEIAGDRSLDAERQVRSLEKWLTIERARYIHDRDSASLVRLREIKGVLNLVKRIRGV